MPSIRNFPLIRAAAVFLDIHISAASTTLRQVPSMGCRGDVSILLSKCLVQRRSPASQRPRIATYTSLRSPWWAQNLSGRR
ncbi:hypothetical protein N656DRAFT_59748 [Canariomyces notabilis]|uniref:Secreted protein n=1 Tax=Canariomyces notabilis TaxID=2074819 RepID=A0AAN6TPG9_9PEZI|nr:hypothetical protein N656DRAFT_59748 [Canariomyces arenarius]